MWRKKREQGRVRRLLPLLESICEEIDERVEAIEGLESMRGHLEERWPGEDRRIRVIDTTLETHRTELAHAFDELRALDCMVIGMDPLTIRVVDASGERRRSFLWRSGDPALSA